MADRTSAERACKEMNPVIDGRKANVNLAYLGAKPRGTTPIGSATAGTGTSLKDNNKRESKSQQKSI